MTHFRRAVFTISKEQDIYIDQVLLDDKRKDKKEFPNGRSEYIRKLINDDMYQKEIPNIKKAHLHIGKCVLDKDGFNIKK